MKATATQTISSLLRKRILAHIAPLSPADTYAYLADTVYQERKRMEKEDNPEYSAMLSSAARALYGSKNEMHASILNLTNVYVEEIHTHFSNKTYDLASKVIPSALSRLLTASQPFHFFGGDFDPASRMIIQGPVETLKKLSDKHTLVFAPTHVSNLDSPLIGYALQAVGLPPVLYGAGLNLFSNPLMSFFLSRLGAYTVDRRKKNQLYKDVLKTYSSIILELGHHSLFYPGGTRSRDGSVEQQVKKGLLGTTLQAWQQNIINNTGKDILVVPCTITSSLVLEAETLIDDALAEKGKARYIISDDEFSEKRTMATFARKVLNLDASIYIRFSTPLDCIGNPVNEEGVSLGPNGETINRRDYICDRSGVVIEDTQRDQQYTKRLAESITEAYQRDSIVLPTHLVARAAWLLLQQQHPKLDTYQLVLLSTAERTVPIAKLVDAVRSLTRQVYDTKVPHALHQDLHRTMDSAYQRFALFHKDRAAVPMGEDILLNAKLAYYYGNRLAHLPLSLEGGSA